MQPIRLCPALALAVAVSCSGGGYPFDDAIEDFAGERFERVQIQSSDTMWEAVYVQPGKTLANSDLRVAIMVSEYHTTGSDLLKWFHTLPQQEQVYHDDGTEDEWCRLGLRPLANGDERPFRLLTVCRDGVERAACVRFSETYDLGEIIGCGSDFGCYKQICTDGFYDYRESLIDLAATTLEKR
jgi:hypothetical protein